MELLTTMGVWHWVVVGLVLLMLEIVLPGVLFLWLGLAGLAVALLLAIVPELGWQAQWISFAVLSLALTVLWHAVLKRSPTETDRPRLNRRAEQYIGREFTLAEPITHGTGKIRVDDTVWKINGSDCPAGTTVRVTAVDGTVFHVEPVA